MLAACNYVQSTKYSLVEYKKLNQMPWNYKQNDFKIHEIYKISFN